ncbi:nucleotide disphospho-sugar-binding domain-containing protein [Streptomyces ficellus]|uniref:DUF1205 domain-containing protein n=1 Tax=Streptomyces ficellus TaxID=1977088 RepID=A0A6I6F3U8_9ACTN|nr:nucleotide disphospho-sugar-binding domain-containing protein [Streptomyces ficellus]QGV77511.1 DUF1205 domain-containing protein [Streptomyces ficellus]
MRILVNTGPSHGLYFPVVPMAWALRAAGHDVLVAGTEGLGPLVSGSGLPFVAVPGPYHTSEAMITDRAGQRLVPPDDEAGVLEHMGRGFARLAARTHDGLSDVVRRWRPDLVLSDVHAYGAGLVAREHGVPWVEHSIGLGYRHRPVMDKWGAEELAPELERAGLAGLPQADLTLDVCPPSLRAEEAATVQPLRYAPYDAPGTLPEWVLREPERPRLLLSMGTVWPAIGGAPLLGRLVAALASLDVDIVAAVDDQYLEQLGPLPPQVVGAGWMPLGSVLPGCDVVVHHGGGGLTMAALRAGLPQLQVRYLITAEQFDSGRRLAELGVGRQAVSEELDLDAVVESTTALLRDSGYRERAGKVRDEIAAMPPATDVVAVIEALAGA